ncbi:MAG: DegV family protein [Oscillospiraceae bacterium]|nr:DegV family protein [Oscillospiraceae bacterium]
MNDYVIYTDSTTDLSPALVEKAGLQVIPMEFTVDGKTYRNYPDCREMGAHEFYDKVRAGSMPTTSLVNAGQYAAIFEPELKAGRDVLFICFSSGLSGSFNCAKLAAAELGEKYPRRKIIALDSLAASMGEGLLVYLAAMEKQKGKSIDEVAQWVTDNRLHLAHWFTVDDLDHLRRGGRVSAAAAFFGGMLNIKPVMHVDDEGHLIPVSKVRGRMASIDAMVAEMEKTAIDPQAQTVFISHGDSPEDVQTLADKVRDRLHPKEIFINPIGPIIGAHSGPGTLAIFFLATQR